MKRSLSPRGLFASLRLGSLCLAALVACFGQTTIGPSGSITFGGSAGKASPYQSTLTVPTTVTGVVTAVSVTINSFSSFVGDIGWILVDNQGNTFVMWTTNSCDAGALSNVTFTLSDSGLTSLVNNTNFTVQNGKSYVPMTACGVPGGGAPTSFPSGGPNPSTADYPTTDGNATFTKIFGGGNNTSPAGTWSLYTFKWSADGTSGSFTWSLNLTTQAASTPTTTSVSPSLASPILTTQSPTFTATVTSSGSPVSTGTVTFTYDNGIAIGSAVALNGSGQATSTNVSFPEGTHTIKAAYSGGGQFEASNGSIGSYVVNHPTTTTTTPGQFCNTGGFSLNYTQNATGTPYPSNIQVTGLSGSVASVSLQLNNGSSGASGPDGVSLLLVDPSGHEFIPVQNTGGTSSVSGINLSLADSAGSGIPTPWVSGTFSPTANGTMATWPAPAPSVTTANAASPEGTASFSSSFLGDTANGYWSLYPIIGRDFDAGNSGSFSGGWCITVTTSGDPASTTTVTSSQNPTLENTNVTITATVQDASTHAAVTAGTVTFKEGTTVLANAVSLNSSGQASFTYSSSVEADHYITAYYSGSTGNHAPSISAPFDERVNHPTTNPSSGVYCNTGSITLPNTGTGPFDALPYPSDITLPFIPGQVTSFTVSANGITVFPQDLDLLLTSPSTQNLVLMEDSGGNTEVTNLNLTFSDAGATMPGTLSASGTYKPIAANTNVSFPSPAPAAASIVFPAPAGSGTLAASFSSSFPANFPGVWSLFANTNAAAPSESIGNGWCMNLTVTAPVATVTKTAVSAPWTQGQQNVTYTIVVQNNGPGSSGGTNPVTVTDTLPASLAPASPFGAGTDWNCSVTSQTITCTNSDIVASGGNYPTLTLHANVSPTAGASVSNTATVTGGGYVSVNSNQTTTTVNPAPALSVSKSSVGTFTQGSTAEWDITLSNTVTGSTTSGQTTVVDTLPAGYTVAGFSPTPAWSCTGSGQAVTCNSSNAVGGGSSFPVLKLTVNVPAASPTSVTNNVVAYGGGSLTQTNSSNGATASNTVNNVVQVPASITVNAGGTQSATVGTAFATPFSVVVKDANNVPIVGSTVTFTVFPGTSGQSGTFPGNATFNTETTGSGGIATASTFTANGIAGSYTVSATDSPATAATFNLTNTLSAPTVTNVSSTVSNGSYGVGAVIPITVTFSHAVTVVGSPTIALNSGGTATFASFSGTTLTFTYTVAAPQSTTHLDASSTGALTLNGGSIKDSSNNNAVLTLPIGATSGSLFSNLTIVIDTTAPTVVSYNVLWGSVPESYSVSANASGRTRLPWNITAIQVVFSKAIATANVNSLTGITATGVSGTGTTTVTWAISPTPIESFSTVLQGTGANAIKDAEGNALAGGSGFTQAFKVLFGDFNDDGVVNITDVLQVQAATSQSYNVLADMNGDGLVTTADVLLVRTRLGTTQQ